MQIKYLLPRSLFYTPMKSNKTTEDILNYISGLKSLLQYRKEVGKNIDVDENHSDLDVQPSEMHILKENGLRIWTNNI